MPNDIVSLSFSYILQGIAVLIILFEVYKKIKEVKKTSDEEHDWEMRVKKAVETVESKEKEWDEALAGVKETRAVLTKEFNKRLDEIESKLEDNHTDTEAKIQEVRAEQEILTECMYATLDGLHQLGCNGKVTEARSMLDQYLIRRAHD